VAKKPQHRPAGKAHKPVTVAYAGGQQVAPPSLPNAADTGLVAAPTPQDTVAPGTDPVAAPPIDNAGGGGATFGTPGALSHTPEPGSALTDDGARDAVDPATNATMNAAAPSKLPVLAIAAALIVVFLIATKGR
jgi:hypothetical protein